MKTCRLCNIEKPYSEFYKREKGSSDGYRTECKECLCKRANAQHIKKYVPTFKSIQKKLRDIVKLKGCNKCKQIKHYSEFGIRVEKGIKYINTYCKYCSHLERKEYIEKNTDKIRIRRKNDWKNNKAKLQISQKKCRPKILAWRKKRNQQSDEKAKNKCRGKLYAEFRYGRRRKRNTCEICHNTPTDCHHEDYRKWDEYIELCRGCHTLLHQQYRDKGIKIEY